MPRYLSLGTPCAHTVQGYTVYSVFKCFTSLPASEKGELSVFVPSYFVSMLLGFVSRVHREPIILMHSEQSSGIVVLGLHSTLWQAQPAINKPASLKTITAIVFFPLFLLY